MQTYVRLSLAAITSLVIFLSLCCSNQSDSTPTISYQDVIKDLQQPSTELTSKQITLLLDRVITLSNTLPSEMIMIDEKELSLSPRKGQLLLAILESDLTDEQLDYIYQRANFDQTFIKDQKLNSAYLQNVVLTHSLLSNVTLTGVDLSNATLANTQFIQSKIADSDFQKANCRKCDFLNSTITTTTFNSSYLREASFTGSRVSKVNMEKANISGVVGLEQEMTQITSLE